MQQNCQILSEKQLASRENFFVVSFRRFAVVLSLSSLRVSESDKKLARKG